MRYPFLAALPWIFFAPGCDPGDSPGKEEEETASVRQPEPWSEKDDPWDFLHTVERRAAALPRSGEVLPIPWPGSYWPTWEDSINHQWDRPDSFSAAKKYELAFDVSGVEDAVSRHHGIDSLPRARVCTRQSECETGETCGKREDETSGRCVPTWYGMCHGWAAAAILFPEPKHSVTVNEVTFEIQDIKALLSIAHNVTYGRFLSQRCEEEESRGTVTYDEHGRATPACRDTNAGTFHLILANLVGVRKQPFIVDGTFDRQVWNQPVRGYTIRSEAPVTEEQALALLDAEGEEDYVFNPDATSFSHVKIEVSYVTGASSSNNGYLTSRIDDFTAVRHYEYVLELGRDGVILGGEWIGDSKRNHPDFLWVPVEVSVRTVAGGKISFTEVKRLAKASLTPDPSP